MANVSTIPVLVPTVEFHKVNTGQKDSSYYQVRLGEFVREITQMNSYKGELRFCWVKYRDHDIRTQPLMYC